MTYILIRSSGSTIIRYSLLLYSILIACFTGMAQQKKYTYEELESMSKDSVISIAEGYIQAKDFSREFFDVVKISKENKGGEKQSYTVIFRPSVMYLSMRHLHYSSVMVNMLAGTLGHGIESKGRRYKWDAPYYRHTREAKKAIRFISKAARRKEKAQPIDKLPKSISVVIHERLLYYHVDINSSSTYGYYRVNKLTGRVYHQGHKHKVVDREDQE